MKGYYVSADINCRRQRATNTAAAEGAISNSMTEVQGLAVVHEVRPVTFSVSLADRVKSRLFFQFQYQSLTITYQMMSSTDKNSSSLLLFSGTSPLTACYIIYTRLFKEPWSYNVVMQNEFPLLCDLSLRFEALLG
jgi:hypothetical protein